MPPREDVAYFGAGPAPLPTSVLKSGAEAFVNFEDSGLSLAEISHRSPTATRILADTKARLTELLEIPDDYEVLFMHGGGSGEFSAVVFNMVATWVEKRRRRAEAECGGDSTRILERVRREVRQDLRLDYLVTGSWSLKASQEAAALLEPIGCDLVNIAVDARKDNGGKFGSIPSQDTWKLSPTSISEGTESAFVYYCDNETVDGVEFPAYPTALNPTSQDGYVAPLVVADMSSNFLSRPVDVSKYAVIFGGAQKNIGITDITLVIVRKQILSTVPPPSFLHAVGMWSPPIIFNWAVIARNNSLYNTMPIFGIWIAGEVMKLLIATYGESRLNGQEEISNAKAKIIYDILDANPETFQVIPHKDVRSRMNICFRVRNGDSASEKKFLEGAESQMLKGLAGHRSLGGARVSNYNAVPIANVKKLAEYLQAFVRGC